MEVIIRGKNHGNAGETLPDHYCPFDKDVHEEVLRRNAKAGYCTKYGESTKATKIQNTVVFGELKLNVWPRDEQGNLIGD